VERPGHGALFKGRTTRTGSCIAPSISNRLTFPGCAEKAMKCPCGTGAEYDHCCGPLHTGQRDATTALELMRSRYTAYYRGELEYLLKTLHPDKHRPGEMQELAATLGETRWLSLSILETRDGQPGDLTGVVEFEARYQAPEGVGTLRERSRFVREHGKWLYVDQEESRQAAKASDPGRNDPCACGSGKKFKKCCGRSA
jgi:SEC-C motif-containing protein